MSFRLLIHEAPAPEDLQRLSGDERRAVAQAWPSIRETPRFGRISQANAGGAVVVRPVASW